MKFFHVYNEECFKGLEKNGMINQDTGFKIQHCFALPEHMKFNNLAAKGGKLYQLLKEGNYPFYVDRLAGGVIYYKYEFDRNLIKMYKDLLGDWFLGFQLHESASNRRNLDWVTIRKKMGNDGPYDPKEMAEKLKSTSRWVISTGEPLQQLNMDNTDVYARQRYAQTPEEFMDEMKDMFLRKMGEVEDCILPCDSFYMATRMQDELGMQTFMPEVGAQIPLMRQEVALARGIAKASKKTWGTYYECWRWEPRIKGCNMPCFNTEPLNEWYLTQEIHGDDFTNYGENGGSSRLLQNRIYYYALMSGADYFSEEWGLNCSYTDMKEFTLSKYGQTKKAFILDAEKFRGVKAMVPFAIVLPKKYDCMELPTIFDEHKLGLHKDVYLEAALSPEEKEYFGHIEDVLKLFFAREGKVYGNEGHVLTNSRFGDVVDIIYEDASDEALMQYDYLIDATKEGSFAKAKVDSAWKILESKDIEKLADTVKKLLPQVLPCYVDDLSWIVSTDDKGRRFLSIFNNEGNNRTDEKGDVIDKEADRIVTISFKEPANLRLIREAFSDTKIQKVDDCTYRAEVPAAGFVILEF